MSKPDKQKSVPVTSLKTLGGGVPTFPLPVPVKLKNGTEAVVQFTAKALRKTEWAALRDAHLGAGKDASDVDAEPMQFSFVSSVGEDMRKGAELVSKCAEGWELEDAFTVASLVDMEDRFGGTLGNFLAAYDGAIFQGRLGNLGQ